MDKPLLITTFQVTFVTEQQSHTTRLTFFMGEKMSCLKGTSLVKKKDAKYVCDKCGSRVTKPKQVCKPVKAEKKTAGKKKKGS
jgi:hypothetical protein